MNYDDWLARVARKLGDPDFSYGVVGVVALAIGVILMCMILGEVWSRYAGVPQ